MKSLLNGIWLDALRLVIHMNRQQTVRLGSDYGGWVLASDALGKNSVVYSIGIGEDISFDLALIKKYGCSVFAFDPTPRSIEWLKKQDLPPQFKSFEIGVAGHDGQAVFFPPENPEFVSHTMLERPETRGKTITVPVRTIATIMKDFDHARIDLLKMDIEGAEYGVIDNILSADLDIRQILVEFHDFFPGVSLLQTIRSTFKLMWNGYKPTAVSYSEHEYSFLKNKIPV